MSTPVYQRLAETLTAKGVRFETLTHEPVYTSAAAAAARGTPLGSGAKALVVKCGEQFLLLVLPADRKLDSKKAAKALGGKGLRFATQEELHELTGLAPGAVPPLGSLFGLPTFLDPALAAHARINFNAGDHATSIQMDYQDYLRAECPTLLELT
jgi:Ala-tRNA(Pro) deacylase